MEVSNKICNCNGRKAIFFDIDGTLYHPSVGMPASAKEGIAKMKEKGHLVFLCTGRTKAMLFNELNEMAFDGIIAGAGTYVEYNGSVLYRYDMDEVIAMNITNELREMGFAPVPEGHDIFYREPESRWTKEYKMVHDLFYNNVGGEIQDMPEDGNGIKAAKMSAVVSEHSDIEAARKKYEDDYLVVIHGNVILELIPKGFSKAEGIKMLLEHTGIDRKDTYAFGDSMNDYEMIKAVNCGVVMANGSAKLKEHASLICEHIDDDGVYHEFKRLNLI